MTDPLYSGDCVFLRALTAECIIGFIDWERRVKQTVVVDLELPVDCRHAAVTDEVADTVDYKKVAKQVLAFIEASEIQVGGDPGAAPGPADPGGIPPRVDSSVHQQAGCHS